MSAVLCAIFFLSGVAGLVFETLWLHQTGLAIYARCLAGQLDGAHELADKAQIGRGQRDSDRVFDDFLAARFPWRR